MKVARKSPITQGKKHGSYSKGRKLGKAELDDKKLEDENLDGKTQRGKKLGDKNQDSKKRARKSTAGNSPGEIIGKIECECCKGGKIRDQSSSDFDRYVWDDDPIDPWIDILCLS
jgi:hypothetical protein